MSVVRSTAAQPVGDLHEQVVAGAVTERVVHELEAVEVEEHHDRRYAAAPVRDRDRVREPVDEELPVREPGERIVQRAVREQRFDVLLALAGRARHADRDREHERTERADRLGLRTAS